MLPLWPSLGGVDAIWQRELGLGGVAEVARQAAAAGYRVRRVGVPWRDTAHLLACAGGCSDGEWL